MADMVEKVARAICVKMGRDPDLTDGRGDPAVPGGFESWPVWAEQQDLARAALEACHYDELVEVVKATARGSNILATCKKAHAALTKIEACKDA